jgi:hypothetical protein
MMYRRKDTVPMTVTLGILALLEAKAGKGDELAAFLKVGRDLAVAEEGTVTWYAFKISDTSYGIFDTFATSDARTAHINGQIPAALAEGACQRVLRGRLLRLRAILLALRRCGPTGRCLWACTGGAGRWCSRWSRATRACAGHRSRPGCRWRW